MRLSSVHSPVAQRAQSDASSSRVARSGEQTDRLAFAPSDLVCIDIFCTMYLIYGKLSNECFLDFYLL